MDKRDFILALLRDYKAEDVVEERSRKQIIDFIEKHKKCFDNDFQLGHITGSALVVDRNFEYTLLTHHSWIDKWFQFGGHSDGENNALEVGLREAKEESGLKSLGFVSGHEGIFDIDIHPIPARGDMPVHNHYDIRIILTADKSESYITSNESKELRWVKLEDAKVLNSQSAFLRLVSKAIKLRESK